MGGNDPYSSSKGCAELLSAAYRKTFFSRTISGLDHPIALATARAGNVIGGGDWATDRLIPDCIRSLAEGKKIRIRNPNATRPWQHVLEPLGGYLILAQALESCGACFAEAWNFGPRDDEIHTVESLVRLLILYWGSGEYLVEPDADIHESQSLKLDISKARSRLRWRPLLNAKDAIERTIQWYRSYYACDGDIAEITRRQIEGYSRLAEDPQH
jgi:CDP-glucose 4,6-dehydratase